MSILKTAVKSLSKAALKNTTKSTDELTGAFKGLTDNFFVKEGQMKNASLRNNEKFVEKNIMQFSQSLGDIRSQMDVDGKVNGDDLYNFVQTKKNLKISQINSELDAGGILQSGGKKQDLDASAFESQVNAIKKEQSGALSSQGFGSKIVSAIRGATKEKGAIGLSGDNQISKSLDKLVGNGTFDGFDEVLGITKGQEWIGKNKNSPDFFAKLSNDGAGVEDGYIQRIGKQFSHVSSDRNAISTMAGRYGQMFDDTLNKASTKLTPLEKELVGLGSSKRELEHLVYDVIEPAIKRNPEFGRSAYRDGMNIDSFNAKAKRMIELADERITKAMEIDGVSSRVKIHRGKTVGAVKNKLELINNKPSDELLHVWNNSDIRVAASNLFDEDFFNRTPPAGFSRIDREKFVSSLTVAAYTDKILTGKLLSVPELADKYSKSFPHYFSVLGASEMAKHVDSVIGSQFSAKTGYRSFIEDVLDSRSFSAFDNADAKKLLVNDFTFSKKMEEGFMKNIKDRKNTFTFSDDGFVKPRRVEIDLEKQSFLEINNTKAGPQNADDVNLNKNAEKLLNDKTFMDNFLDGLKNIDAVFKQFWKNPKDSGTIQGLKRYSNTINYLSSELDRMNTSIYFKNQFNLQHMDSFLSGKLTGVSKRAAAAFESSHKLMKQQDEILTRTGYYQDGAQSQMGSRVHRSSNRAIAKGEYKRVQDSLSKHFNKTGDRKKAFNAMLSELDPNSKDTGKIKEIASDLLFPAQALSHKLSHQARAIATVKLSQELKKSGMIAFNNKIGYTKLSNQEVNLKFFEDVFGSQNVYLNTADAKQVKRLLKDYTQHFHQTGKDLLIEGNNMAARAIRHNMLMFPSTYVMVEGGNLLMYQAALNVNPAQAFRLRKNANYHYNNRTPRYNEFIRSGIASSETALSSIAKKSGRRSGGETSKSFLQRANIFNPDSDLGGSMLYHLVEKPDTLFRFSIWDSMNKAGKSSEEILKVIERTVGTAESVPSIIKNYSNFPGGDLFAAYSYTMATNMFRVMNNNPKAYFKTVLALGAIQQASTYAFMNEKERSDLKNGKEWMRPSILNTLRLDPSLATPSGNYLVNSYFSPYALSAPSWEQSLTPTSLIIKALMSGAKPDKVFGDVSKMGKKLSQASEKLSQSDYIGATSSAAGFFIRDISAN